MKKILKYPSLFRFGMNLWPPFTGSGIYVESLSTDYRQATVKIKFRWWNKNANRTQYGGSIFSCTDPIYPLMLMGVLGKEYHIWDSAGSIRYLKPGQSELRAEFRLSEPKLEEIRAATVNGDKHFAEFVIPVLDSNDELVAEVSRTIYIRKKRKYRPTEAADEPQSLNPGQLFEST